MQHDILSELKNLLIFWLKVGTVGDFLLKSSLTTSFRLYLSTSCLEVTQYILFFVKNENEDSKNNKTENVIWVIEVKADCKMWYFQTREKICNFFTFNIKFNK